MCDQQGRDDYGRDEKGCSQLPVLSVAETLEDGIEEIERTFDAKRPDQRNCSLPIQPQCEECKERQYGGEQAEPKPGDMAE